jgi:hypothetical protein
VDRGRSVAVKGIPVCGKPVPFAGRRRNASLGRSMSSAGGSSLVGARTGDSGCPEGAEEGNVVGVRPFKAYALDARAIAKTLLAPQEDASFTRSSDPCASIVTKHRRGNSLGGGAAAAVSQSGKPSQEGGTGGGVAFAGRMHGSPLDSRSRKGEGAVESEPEGGRGHRPSEERESSVRARTSK